RAPDTETATFPAGRVFGGHHSVSGAHGDHEPRRRAGDQPVPRRARALVEKVQAPRGTFDVLPDSGRARLGLLRLCEETLERAGYGPFETPIFEATELFERGVGETTDVVQKEMFTFDDQGGRSFTLRPEGT